MNFKKLKNGFLKKKLSINQLAKADQKKNVFYIFMVMIGVILIGFMLMSPKKESHPTKTKKSVPDMVGTTSSEFTASESASALTKEEGQITDLEQTIKKMNENIQSLHNAWDKTNHLNQEKIEALQLKFNNLRTQAEQEKQKKQKEQNNLKGNVPWNTNGRITNGSKEMPGISTTTFSYPKNSKKNNAKTWKNYVPPGTFAQAVALNGADTNAGVNGQTDTSPITLRVLSEGTLPNGKKTHLKNCFVTASAYGNASSERGEIRLQHLSCIRNNGHVLSIPVEGYLTDQGGTDGIRGHVVMRNGQLLFNAGAAGFLSGIGSAMQQSLTTQATSPLGTTSTVHPSKVFEYGAAGGANTALSKLADYYIKLADLYHPIIQIHAGSLVDIVFLKGFSLATDRVVEEKSAPTIKTTTQNFLPQNLIKQLKNSKLGQTINGDAS